MMSSQHREDKLHEIDDLLRRCHNEAVYQLLLDERQKLKRDLRHSSKHHQDDRHRYGDRPKSRSHAPSNSEIQDSKSMGKHGNEKKKAATLDPRMEKRKDGSKDPHLKSNSKSEHRKAHRKTERSKERISKQAGISEDKLLNAAKVEVQPKKQREHKKLQKAVSEPSDNGKKSEDKNDKREKKLNQSNTEGNLNKFEQNEKQKTTVDKKATSETKDPKMESQKLSHEKNTHKKNARTSGKKKVEQTHTKKQQHQILEIKLHPPMEPPLKEFTADEIEQMSKNHRSKLKPTYIENTKDNSTTTTTKKVKPPTSPTTPKAAMWKEISPKSSNEKAKTLPTSIKVEDSYHQPVIQTLRRGDFNASSGSSTISSRLMKLKEGDRKPTKKASTPVNGVATQTERDGNKVLPPAKAETKIMTEAKIPKPRNKMHKLLRWQQSSPAVLEEHKRPPYLDIGNGSVTEKKTENMKPSLETGENQQVVFHVDLDELNRRNSKTKTLSSFFKQRVTRTKSAEKRQTTTKECETQTVPWLIPALLMEQATQTAHVKVLSASTQTFTTGRVAATQTIIRKHDKAVQFQPRCFTTETQTTSSGVASETQTEDEDSPVWGSANRLSLDRLVRTRGRRKVKMKRASSQDAINTESQELDETILKRATTLPHGGAKEGQKSKQIITSFNWTQTDKFVKIVVSYSGAHLIPSENINVTTNGINLRLKISNDENSESNKNTNNNSTQGSIPAELYISRLRYFVSGLSYTVQPDMLTVLLRKQKIQEWESLMYTNTQTTVNV